MDNKICPLCKGSNTVESSEAHVYKETEYVIHTCLACLSQFASPMRPAEESFYDSYPDPIDRWEYDIVASSIQEFGIADKVLEIGCGRGHFLEKLKRNSIEAEGIDLNENNIREAQSRSLNCSLLDVNEYVGNRSFRCISLFHVLEHLNDPDSFLALLNSICLDGEYVFLSFPNINRHALNFMREDLDCPPNHLTRISHEGVLSLFQRSGFEMVSRNIQPDDTTVWKAMSLAANNMLRNLGLREKIKRIRIINYMAKSLLFALYLPKALYYMLAVREKQGDTVLYCFRKKRGSAFTSLDRSGRS